MIISSWGCAKDVLVQALLLSPRGVSRGVSPPWGRRPERSKGGRRPERSEGCLATLGRTKWGAFFEQSYLRLKIF